MISQKHRYGSMTVFPGYPKYYRQVTPFLRGKEDKFSEQEEKILKKSVLQRIAANSPDATL